VSYKTADGSGATRVFALLFDSHEQQSAAISALTAIGVAYLPPATAVRRSSYGRDCSITP